MVIELLYAEPARVVSRFGEETLAAGTGREGPGVGAEPDPAGGKDFEARSHANKSNATNGSDSRRMNIGLDRVGRPCCGPASVLKTGRRRVRSWQQAGTRRYTHAACHRADPQERTRAGCS